ncbi:hypothetical protein FSP39_024916 [Pinctada imbricata]|uniref:Zinc finger PHD-type domain-containing protein n=1 Tax=Pinctada imbricata TaxID=66713 RepID=A0AA88YU16_PINIB|nr:hypothetical protein FSP39_024916 [Pinctada imbricata]
MMHIGATPSDRLEGLEPAAQEFHKRMLLLQDVVDMFFCGSGLTDKGTLCHLKNLLGFRNVTKDVGTAFNHVSEFLYVVTVGYTVLLAMDLLNMKDLDEANVSLTLDDVTDTIVHKIWMETNYDAVINPDSDQPYDYCYCKEENEEDMIECSGPRCRCGKWFHLTCIQMTQDEVPDGDWFRNDCETLRSLYPFCICYTDLGTAMIACDNPECEREWYHLSCVGITDVPSGRWYCCVECEKKHTPENPDRLRDYILSLLFHGLLDLTRKDCVRENDGPMIIQFWKYDLVPFHNRNHSKYVILAHRLIAGVSGWLPRRLAEDLTWNRTVNLAGGPGRNIEMDLAVELLNNEFKQSLSDAGGNITEETVARHSQLVGYLGRTIDKIYGNITGLVASSDVKTSKVDIKETVFTMINIMKKENVFASIPGRKFRSFPEFNCSMVSKNPKRLHQKLKELSKKLDRLRRIVSS